MNFKQCELMGRDSHFHIVEYCQKPKFYSDISNSLGGSESRTAFLIKKLVAAGLIIKKQNPNGGANFIYQTSFDGFKMLGLAKWLSKELDFMDKVRVEHGKKL